MVRVFIQSLVLLLVVLIASCSNPRVKPAETLIADTPGIDTNTYDDNTKEPIPTEPDTIIVKPVIKVDKVIDTLVRDTVRKDSIPRNVDSIPVRKFGQLILDEKLIASDSPITFQVMDSLVANKVKDRQFYFKVFNKIMGRADGALSEAIGVYSRKFVEKHTKEFFAYSSKFSTIEMGAWASQLGIELFLAEEHPKDAYTKTAKRLKENCASCDASTQKRIEEFNAMIWQTIKENQVKK